MRGRAARSTLPTFPVPFWSASPCSCARAASVAKTLSEQGIRDDIGAALERNEGYHRRLGLSMKDNPYDPSDTRFQRRPSSPPSCSGAARRARVACRNYRPRTVRRRSKPHGGGASNARLGATQEGSAARRSLVAADDARRFSLWRLAFTPQR